MTKQTLALTLLLSGGIVSMPVVMVGHILASSYGSVFALCAILVGNCLLYGVACVNAHLALKYRTTTTETVGRIGGLRLAKVFSVAMIVSMLGWFAVQCSVLVSFVQGYWQASPYWIVALLVGASLVVTTMGDIKRLLWLSERIGPVLLVLCVGMLWWSWNLDPAVADQTLLLPALSLIVATSLGVAIDVPTFYRFASSKKEAFISLFIVVVVVTSMVETLGVMLASKYSIGEIISTPFGLVLALSGWLMNINNLYSAVVSSQTLTKVGSFKARAIILGGLALMLVLTQVAESLTTFIEVITLGISSMGGVIVACVLTKLRAGFALALTWAVGMIFGALSLMQHFPLTNAAQLDAFIVSCVVSTIYLLGVKSWQSQLSMKKS